MKDFTFVAWCRFGRGDSGETEVSVDLTDEEAERLIAYGTKADTFYDGFFACKELKDIYKKVYAIAVRQMTEETRDFGNDDHTDDPDWVVDDTYACGVEFPRDFAPQEFEDDEDWSL